MLYGPNFSSKLSTKLGHLLKVKPDKTYTITTQLEDPGSNQFALIIYRIAGSKKKVFYLFDEIKRDTKHILKFNTPKDSGTFLVTHWEKKGNRWIQIKIKEQ